LAESGVEEELRLGTLRASIPRDGRLSTECLFERGRAQPPIDDRGACAPGATIRPLPRP